jgi:hypothetical protein
LIADLESDFPFHDVEPLLLRVVKVKRGAFAWLEIAVFDDKEIAGGIGGGDLEGERTGAKCARSAEAILAGGDQVERGWRRGGGLGEYAVKSRDGERRGGGLEEAAAGYGHGGMIRHERCNATVWGTDCTFQT